MEGDHDPYDIMTVYQEEPGEEEAPSAAPSILGSPALSSPQASMRESPMSMVSTAASESAGAKVRGPKQKNHQTKKQKLLPLWATNYQP